jgi:hypothetical protein
MGRSSHTNRGLGQHPTVTHQRRPRHVRSTRRQQPKHCLSRFTRIRQQIVWRIASTSAFGVLAHISPVSVAPGTTAFTRIPCPGVIDRQGVLVRRLLSFSHGADRDPGKCKIGLGRPIHHTDFEPARSWHANHMRELNTPGDMSRPTYYLRTREGSSDRSVSKRFFQNGSGSKLPS